MITSPLEVIEGNDPVVTLTVTRDGEPVDLTGSTLNLYVKASASTADASALFTYSSGGGSPKITITDATGGIASIAFAKADLATPGTYWYKVNVTFSTGKVETVIAGTFKVVNV